MAGISEISIGLGSVAISSTTLEVVTGYKGFNVQLGTYSFYNNQSFEEQTGYKGFDVQSGTASTQKFEPLVGHKGLSLEANDISSALNGIIVRRKVI